MTGCFSGQADIVLGGHGQLLDPVFAPSAHGVNDRHQGLTESRERITDLRLGASPSVPGDQLILNEFPQLAGQHFVGYFGQQPISSLKRYGPW